MSDFAFNGSERFSENCKAFLESVKDIDPEMATILEENWDKIVVIVSQGERDAKARVTFNESIAAALDGFIERPSEEDQV